MIKNWANFQHYKERKPPWIKLHRDLLDDYKFHCLPVASRALAPMIWLLASESDEGKIDLELEELTFRLRMTEKDFMSGLNPLINNGFVESGSNPLAGRKQGAMLETETETEKSNARKEGFNDFWKAYPNKKGKAKAEAAYLKAVSKSNHKEIMSGLDAYKSNKEDWRQWAHPTTWLNGECWKDEYASTTDIKADWSDPKQWDRVMVVDGKISKWALQHYRNNWPIPGKNFPEGCPPEALKYWPELAEQKKEVVV